MGAAKSTAQPIGTLIVVPERTTYSPGETMRGTLYVKLDKEVQGSPSIEVIGEEFTCVHYTTHTTTHSGTGKHRTTHRHTHHHVAHGVRQLCTIAVPFSDCVITGPGNFEIPFCLPLPSHLPSSFKLGSQSYCGIRYYASAKFLDCSAPSVYFQVNGRGIQYPDDKIFMEPRTISVSSCFCFDRGRFTLGGSVNKSLFCAGETALVQVAVSNNTDIELESLHVAITQSVQYSAKGHSKSFSNIIGSGVLNPSVFRAAGGKGTSLDLHALRDELLKSNENSSRILGVAISSSSLPSYKGSLLSVEYCVSIVGKLQSSFATTAPTIVLPLHVQPPVSTIALDTVISAVSPFAQSGFQGVYLTEYYGTFTNNQGQYTIPSAPQMISSVPIPSDWSAVAMPLVVINQPFVVGGQPVYADRKLDGAPSEGAVFTPEYDTSASPASGINSPYSFNAILTATTSPFDTLITSLRTSFDQVNVIRSFIDCARYGGPHSMEYGLLCSISPITFGSIISEIKFTTDVNNGAILLAQGMISVNNPLTCAHVASAVQVQPEYSSTRTDLVKLLGPLCSDIQTNKQEMLRPLTEFQRVICG